MSGRGGQSVGEGRTEGKSRTIPDVLRTFHYADHALSSSATPPYLHSASPTGQRVIPRPAECVSAQFIRRARVRSIYDRLYESAAAPGGHRSAGAP